MTEISHDRNTPPDFVPPVIDDELVQSYKHSLLAFDPNCVLPTDEEARSILIAHAFIEHIATTGRWDILPELPYSDLTDEPETLQQWVDPESGWIIIELPDGTLAKTKE